MKRNAVFLIAVLTIVLILVGCGTSSKNPGADFDGMISNAESLLSEGDAKGAVDAYAEIIGMFPDSAEAFLGRARALIVNEDDLQLALQDYLSALDIDENSVQAALGVTDVYIRTGEFGQAEKFLREFSESIENNEEINVKLQELESDQVFDSDGRLCRLEFYVDGVFTGYHYYEYKGNEKCRVSQYSPDDELINQVDIGRDEMFSIPTSTGVMVL